ncbi:histidine phosphatase family protein [Thioclava sp.]|uniref:histidine phosphatase family protein n=1 Tax=Thioclava sp. TaxID=1933450 RepID=UPI003AA86969
MDAMAGTELLLIRHAQACDGGCLAGRRDVAAQLPGPEVLAKLRALIGPARLVASPALRCVQTVAALWPDQAVQHDTRLWEQDFGQWEGVAYGDLPDLGPLDAPALAAHRPPGGESFNDLCARVRPALMDLAGQGGRIAVIAHAGVVRAGLAHALGSMPAALAFQVAPLSITRMTALAHANWSVACVNQSAQ